MTAMLDSYARVLRRPGALAFSAAGLVARLPISMVGLGIVLLVEERTGSYGLAGTVSAVFVLAEAAFAVLHGRCSMIKLYASEMAGRVADRCVQVFGGRGYMRENVAERFARELRVERIWEGASELQRVIVADQLVKRGLSALV